MVVVEAIKFLRAKLQSFVFDKTPNSRDTRTEGVRNQA